MAATHVATPGNPNRTGYGYLHTHQHQETPTHSNGAKRRTRARYDANLGNGVGDPSTEEGRLVLGTRERQLTGDLIKSNAYFTVWDE